MFRHPCIPAPFISGQVPRVASLAWTQHTYCVSAASASSVLLKLDRLVAGRPGAVAREAAVVGSWPARVWGRRADQ